MMEEEARFIVNALNKDPFNKIINLVTFDSLEPPQLVQILNDVLSFIEDQPTFDVLDEPPAEQAAVRLFEALKILRYEFPIDENEIPVLECGKCDKRSIYPVLTWLLQRLPELKQRAYLAQFLIHVYVPPQFQSDSEIYDMILKCNGLMEEFQRAHKSYTTAKLEGTNVEEIRQDIISMNEEREQLSRRVERCKKKVENVKNKDVLSWAKMWRIEKEREAQLTQQKLDQITISTHAEQRIQRMQQQIKELQQHMDNAKPEDLIKSLAEQNKIHRYMVEEKFPKEIEAKRKAVEELQKIASVPTMDLDDLEPLKKRINMLNDDIAGLVRQKNLVSDPADDKLVMFRQQANIVRHKKQTTAEELNDTRLELENLLDALAQKKDQVRHLDDKETFESAKFAEYVNKMRTKTNAYKKKRADLQDLAVEIGILTRTEELLRIQMNKLTQGTDMKSLVDPAGSLDNLGDISRSGTKQLETSIDELAGKSEHELEAIASDISKRIASKKKDVGATVQELRPLREAIETLAADHSRMKAQYDERRRSMTAGITKLEQEIINLRRQMTELEKLRDNIIKENQFYSDFLSKSDSNPRYAGELVEKISEAEATNRHLKEERTLRMEEMMTAAKRQEMWVNLHKLMLLKTELRQDARNRTVQVSSAKEKPNIQTDGMKAQFNPRSRPPVGGTASQRISVTFQT